MTYKSMTIEDIIAWCKQHDQVEWLKAECKKKTPYKVYPRVKVEGKSVVDKTAEPKIEMRPISFIQIKSDFVEQFMPELKPKKVKKTTLYERVEAL